MRLGLDIFSLRSQGLTAAAALEFCAARGITLLHLSEPRFLGPSDPASLREVRARALALGIELEVGMLSIAPGATIFNAAAGAAEEQLARTVDTAAALGATVVRCVVGSFRDRLGNGRIEQRIDEAAQTIRAVRPRALDAGVRIAVENHAGDLQSRELRALVEMAGPDVTGVCFDAGNALWAMEDPRTALETLAPHVLTSHTRDTAVRATPAGAEVAWTRMGEGNIGIQDYLAHFQRLCPGLPLTLEIIVMPAPRALPFRDRAFWDGYREMRAWEFQRFADLVAGAPPAALPEGPVGPAEELANLEASLEWTRYTLSPPP